MAGELVDEVCHLVPRIDGSVGRDSGVILTGAAIDLDLDYTESELAMLKSSLDHADAVCTKRYSYDLYHTLIVDPDGTGGDLLDLARARLLQAKEAEPARAYLASRALPDAIVAQFKIGYAPLSANAMRTWANTSTNLHF